MTEQEQLEICAQCDWKIINEGRSGHCYMFEIPLANCKQFKPIESDELN